MSGTIVDSNVLLDIIQGDKTWGDWSSAALRNAAQEGALLINPIGGAKRVMIV